MRNLTASSKVEHAIERLIATGRFSSKDEVIREGVRLLEEREHKLERLNAALSRGIADAEAGRVTPADDVFARLERKYQ